MEKAEGGAVDVRGNSNLLVQVLSGDKSKNTAYTWACLSTQAHTQTHTFPLCVPYILLFLQPQLLTALTGKHTLTKRG